MIYIYLSIYSAFLISSVFASVEFFWLWWVSYCILKMISECTKNVIFLSKSSLSWEESELPFTLQISLDIFSICIDIVLLFEYDMDITSETLNLDLTFCDSLDLLVVILVGGGYV